MTARVLRMLGLLFLLHHAQAEERANFFNDPFIQATNGIASCPVPKGPEITRAEMLSQSHVRAERGTRCYMAGRCRLPNSYLYDKEIVPRIKTAIDADGRFTQTSVWVEGARRWIWLKGCVRRKEEARRSSNSRARSRMSS